MPTTSTLSTEFFILMIRIGMVGAIYLFLWHVLRVTSRQLKQVAEAQAVESKLNYGTLLVIRAGVGGPPLNAVYSLQQRTTIGRSESNTITLNDDIVSQKHAEIVWRGGRAFIEDLGSANGTFLNDSEVRGSTPIEHGNHITIGYTTFKWLGQ